MFNAIYQAEGDEYNICAFMQWPGQQDLLEASVDIQGASLPWFGYLNRVMGVESDALDCPSSKYQAARQMCKLENASLCARLWNEETKQCSYGHNIYSFGMSPLPNDLHPYSTLMGAVKLQQIRQAEGDLSKLILVGESAPHGVLTGNWATSADASMPISFIIKPNSVYPDFGAGEDRFPTAARHDGYTNACMADGHAEAIRPTQYRLTDTEGPSENRYWLPRYTITDNSATYGL